MNVALIVLAGKGTRMGIDTPKQFYLFKNKPLFYYSLKTFSDCYLIDRIVLVTNDVKYTREIVEQYNFKKVTDIVVGGPKRSDSVLNGLNCLKNKDDIVLIHDALRVFVDEKIITDNINACKKYDAVVTAVKEINSVSKVKDGVIVSPLNREETYIHQTPQTFKVGLIKDVYKNGNTFTDEANLVASKKIPLHIVEGNYSNIKITNKEDLLLLNEFI